MSQKFLTRLSVGLVAGLGLGMFLPGAVPPASAQLGADALKDANQQNTDQFSNSGNSRNPIFDLIHRATLGSGKSAEEFNAEQSESLDSATADFRARQQEKLRNAQTPQSAPATGAPVTAVPAPPSK